MNKFINTLISALVDILTNGSKKADNPTEPNEIVEKVSISFDENILYVDAQKGLNIRKNPVIKNNIIDCLLYGEEVSVIKKSDRWYKVKCKSGLEGWVASEYLDPENPRDSTSQIKKDMANNPPIIFELNRPNKASSSNTKRLREYIGQTFGHTEKSDVNLQCVEYVQYKVKTNIGIDIIWPSDRPRHGGRWSSIFIKNKKYKILKEPLANTAMCFSNPNFNVPYGHIAFVEEVFPDGSIRITEANWPGHGMFNDRVLSKQQWSSDRWGSEFINFT